MRTNNDSTWLTLNQPVYVFLVDQCVWKSLIQDPGDHDSSLAGHPGRDRILWNVSKFFFWPGMGKTVKEFVRSCDSCQRSKSSRAKVGLLPPLPVPKDPWEDITMDFIMGLPQTDRHHDANIIVFVDRLTKYVHLIPTISTISSCAEGAARLYIDHVFLQHGLSKTIVSDRDPRFTATFKEHFSILGTKLQMSSAKKFKPSPDWWTDWTNESGDRRNLESFCKPSPKQLGWTSTGVPICD